MDLYISDLDGTLLNSEQVVSDRSAGIINGLIEAGLNFTIATARSYEASKNILEPLHLKLPVILNNGAFIYSPFSGKNIVENYLSHEDVDFILDSYLYRNISPFVSAVDSAGNKKIFYKGVFNRGQEIYINSRRKNKDRRLQRVSDFSIIGHFNIINIFSIEESGRLDYEYKLFKDKLNVSCHYTEEIYSKGFFWLETTNINANKSCAALYLKKCLKADRLICFGDNLNDAPLFRAADVKYAVKNAYAQLKKLATGVIDSNNEDGVAEFLKLNSNRI
ncbi:MAG: HAD family hydrolase [Clostridium sp.]|uniref:HAD family hydrolase n=1 Tax=Clostridium sp. TaxID=1506 RepID=UPI0025B89026|nr:HAD family hydrolase [Clostridium sp.]MCH3964425.1 HAD family hydrolase [Clostridium sp.]MCI1715600.1 HAD family hydrolase [Clostridium sp.]MCI1799608.1 HAD family hydrolase [Clostridium sp.]MCI1813784.1 HAD family hydrolase [Clostridium sp.]MCI1870421.1 HAD family hydrolase [Clostridium sp.]